MAKEDLRADVKKETDPVVREGADSRPSGEKRGGWAGGPAAIALWAALFLLLGGVVGWSLARTLFAPQPTQIPTLHAHVESEWVPVRSPGAGTVRELKADVGHPVEKGDVLVVVRDDGIEARTDKALADVRTLRQRLREAREKPAEVKRRSGPENPVARQALKSAGERLAVEEQRLRRIAKGTDSDYVLYESNPLPTEPSSSGMSARDMARRRVEEARAEVEALRERREAGGTPEEDPGRLREWEEVLRSADREIEAIREALDAVRREYLLVGPVRGLVMRSLVQVGETVRDGQVLLWVADLDGTWLEADLDPSDVGKVQVGQKVQGILEKPPGTRVDGEIARVELIRGGDKGRAGDPDPSDPSASDPRYRIRVTPQNCPVELVPGMKASVRLGPPR
ncbi:MAG TPA: efflux RND transporter periplasmic adaptor subunit [Syntrophobacteraceae bacterium]|nr:efflux RND transporter periplasmic adaptor subunit [Syntrophobacteraceae bacterium]